MAILNNSNAISTAGGYDINNSLRFRASASAYLNRTPTTNGSDVTWTLSTWVKRGQLGVQQTILSTVTSATIGNFIGFLADDTFSAFRFGTTYQYRMITTQVFRDPSAWYHILEVYDSTQATAADRVKIYINGVQVTAFSTATYPALNGSAIGMNKTLEHRIGRMYSGATYLDGYLTETYMVDGQALTPSDFGETDTTTGSWKPKEYTGTYGTNGFYLNFSDIATTSGSNAGLGKDFSGNGNYWTTNNISVTAGVTYDAMTDSPTLTSATVANYAVMNPLTYTGTLASGNLELTTLASYGTSNVGTSTIDMSTGSWYWEVNKTSGSSTILSIGVVNSPTASSTSPRFLYSSNGTYSESGSTVASGKNTYATNDVIGIALNASTQVIEFFKNGVSQGSYTMSFAGPYFAQAVDGDASLTCVFAFNFGQRPFAYTPPTGYLALNTFNLPNSTIVKGSTVMDATTYTGNGSSLAVTNSGSMKPDFLWIKGRSGATDHQLLDTVRGANGVLVSNSTAAETVYGADQVAFNTNGFTVGGLGSMNTASATYVGWQWQAGQGSSTSNTSGSITSTVSANTTAGFSVVTYTGTGSLATVGHGLGVAPKMVIVKDRDSANNWIVYNENIGNTNYLRLNTTDASASSSGVWNNTSPTSTVFTVNTTAAVNGSGNDFVAYCFAEISGFSKIGSYTGNGSANGPFVYTGFRPKFIMIKSSSTGGTFYDWVLYDTARMQYNVCLNPLAANLSNNESYFASNYQIDILSNGFKARNAGGNSTNVSNVTYIYMAFAENPFKNANAR